MKGRSFRPLPETWEMRLIRSSLRAKPGLAAARKEDIIPLGSDGVSTLSNQGPAVLTAPAGPHFLTTLQFQQPCPKPNTIGRQCPNLAPVLHAQTLQLQSQSNRRFLQSAAALHLALPGIFENLRGKFP